MTRHMSAAELDELAPRLIELRLKPLRWFDVALAVGLTSEARCSQIALARARAMADGSILERLLAVGKAGRPPPPKEPKRYKGWWTRRHLQHIAECRHGLETIRRRRRQKILAARA